MSPIRAITAATHSMLEDLSRELVGVAFAVLAFMLVGTVIFNCLFIVFGRTKLTSRTTFADKPGERFMYEGKDRVLLGAFILWGILCLLATALLVLLPPIPCALRASYLIGWLIFPPIWFMIEHIWFYPARGVAGSESYYQHGRKMSASLWFAGSAICFFAATNPPATESHRDRCSIHPPLGSMETRDAGLDAGHFGPTREL